MRGTINLPAFVVLELHQTSEWPLLQTILMLTAAPINKFKTQIINNSETFNFYFVPFFLASILEGSTAAPHPVLVHLLRSWTRLHHITITTVPDISTPSVISLSLSVKSLESSLLLGWDGWNDDGWLDGWYEGWLDDWYEGWLTDWLFGWIAGWLGGWMAGWLGSSLCGWLGHHDDPEDAELEFFAKEKLVEPGEFYIVK